MRIFALVPVVALVLLTAGCEHPTSAPAAPRTPGRGAHGGSLVIDHTRLVAWAADADNHALHRVDLLSARVVSSAVEGAPEQVVLTDDHHLAVTVRDSNRVELFEVDIEGVAHLLRSTEVAADPFGLALSPRGELLVTSAWSHTLSALDAITLSPLWSVDLAREPRAVVITGDGSRAFITHLTGNALSIVDLDPEEPVVRRAPVLGGLHRNRIDQSLGADTLRPTAALAYAAVISEGGGRLFVPHVIEQNGSATTRSVPFGYGGVPIDEDTSQASVAVLMTQGERILGPIAGGSAPAQSLAGAASIAPQSSLGVVIPPGAAPTRQARAAALLGDQLLVASLGTGELVELDARAFDPAMSVRRRFNVGEGPKGVDVDATTQIAVVWNQLSHDVAIVALDAGTVERVPVSGDPLSPEMAAGRRLFFTEGDRRISRDGRSCAGCHPDGRDDGVVWKLGGGPRQTPTLLGRLGQGPYGWLGKHSTLEGNMQETMSRLGGTGLPDADLRRLALFLRDGLVTPTRPSRELPAEPLVERGKAIFHAQQVGCSGCHAPATELSDRSLHDVGSAGKTDTTRMFRTPPLLHLGGSAPYFHDGRYATLEQLLDDNLDRMGQTTQLSPDDLQALAAYLRTL